MSNVSDNPFLICFKVNSVDGLVFQIFSKILCIFKKYINHVKSYTIVYFIIKYTIVYDCIRVFYYKILFKYIIFYT